jgi:hypothetical protein
MTDRDRTPERPRRPEVGRSGPIRNLGGLFRSPGHSSASSASTGAATGAPGDVPRAFTPDEAVARAVRAGFEVAEQAVRRGLGGARAAFGGDTTGSHDGEPGADWSTGWTAGPYVDAVAGAATRWIDAWASLLQQAVTVTGAAARSAVPARPGPAAEGAPAPATATRLVVEVRSRRAASVQLDIDHAQRQSAGGALTTHGLHAPPALGAPPLTEVALAVDSDGRLRVRVEVPDTQPAGAYVGAVVTSSGDAIGTLAVRLAE